MNLDGPLLAAGIILAFVALCVGCAIFEAVTRPTVDRLVDDALAPDYDAGIAAMDRLGKSANR